MHPISSAHSFTEVESLSSDELLQAKKSLRKALRHRRNQLSSFAQVCAAQQVLRRLSQQHWFKHSRKIAVYLASDGEIDCNAIIQALLRQGKQIYLPVLHPINHRQLLFVQYDSNTPMRYNRFGIKEPQLKRSRIVPAQALDIILMPLVGFDASGNRLGMGGGFYDTSLEKVVNSGWNKTPMRVGLAHNCQQVSHLPKEPWDVPLNQVITPDFVLSVK